MPAGANHPSPDRATFDLVGAALFTGLIAGLGFGLGQRTVDVVLRVDRYAGLVSLGLIVTTLLIPPAQRLWRSRVRARTRVQV